MTIHITIPGKPMVWSRPRVNSKGPKTFIYDPKADERMWVGINLRPHFNQPIEGPLKLEIVAYYKTPKKKLYECYKETRPDCDNIIKAVCDCLNKVAYYDDAQVAFIQACKKWGSKDETHVFVTKL